MQGKTINGFVLQRLLGVGGMAEVWYAENEIGMKVAVKILSEALSLMPQMKERFLNEAKVMVQLDHPNIRKVHGFGSIDDRPTIIMEYLEGTDLKARMKRGQRFSDHELRMWWNQLVDALAYTHRQNIVHRDIKPSNIFIDQNGNAKLLDFGIAKVVDTTSGTQTGSTLGTRIYMSPEQVKDPKRVSASSDAYSLAVSFVHLLSGKAPYDATTSSDYDIQVSIVTKPIDLSGIPVEWQEMLSPYLEKEPDKRPPLRPFVMETKPVTPPADSDATMSEDMKTVKQPATENVTVMNPEAKRKSPVLPWIVAAVACVVAVLALLRGGKKEVAPVNIPDETEVVEEVQPTPDVNVFPYDEIGAKVFAESNQVMSGQKYHAKAMVTAWQNTPIKAKVSLDGGTEKEFTSNSQGEIDLEFNVGLGKHKYSGVIYMPNPKTNEMEEYSFENNFTVVSPAMSVSATKMNVVYTGIDNPIAIAGGMGGDISATATGANLTKTGNGTYNLRVVGNPSVVTVNVSSQGSSLGSMNFRVKDLPKPTPIIRNVVNGQCSRLALLGAGGVEVVLKDFDFEGIRYEVVGYTFRYKTKAGRTKEAKANGPQFTEEMRNAINAANVGDFFVFSAIQVKGNDNKVKTLDTPIGVEIK